MITTGGVITTGGLIITDGVIATGGVITTGGVATTVAGRTVGDATVGGDTNPRVLTPASLAPESAIAARDTKAIRQGGVKRTSLSSTALSCVKRPRLPRRTGGPSVQHSAAHRFRGVLVWQNQLRLIGSD